MSGARVANAVIFKVLEKSGVTKWGGFRWVSAFITAITFRIAKGTGAKWLDYVLWQLVIEAAMQAAGRVYEQFKYDVYNAFARPVERSTIFMLYELSGVEPKSLDKAGLYEWAGKIAAKRINTQMGTDFKTVYPVKPFIDQAQPLILAGIMNGGAVEGIQVMSASKAMLIIRQVTDSYNVRHGIDTKKLQQKELDKLHRNVVYQQTYRETHPQTQIPILSPNVFIKSIARKAMDDYYALYAAELERRAAEKAAASGGAP